ncbi:OmpA family protein [Desertivirga brevis]|uniref:OmpA family protein n=1 Tax=Desertivirga brevis TaxID=2810310 RepID=UPI001F6216C8|nr:OmpA family protein [Pedobacter sp. SYSU D00873]
MKLFKMLLTPMLVASLVISFSSCKSKKKLTKEVPPPAVEREKPAVEEKAKTTEPVEQTSTNTASASEKLNFNFKNIQFEFNSAVLKTFSYEVLDKIATEMRKSPDTKFEISGHSSAEGSEQHNKSLSEDRANAVKAYLVNAGISAANLSTIGYGESKPITKNTTEADRALNRRVEIKKTN